MQVSNRKRFNIVSSHWETQLSKNLVRQQLEEQGDKIMAKSTEQYRMVQRVFGRLIPPSGLPEDSWEIYVIDKPDVSAFVLPGGKVFVYRGMIDFCTSDDEMAVILSHEIAHNVAHHGSETVSRNLIWLVPYSIGRLCSGARPDVVQLAADVAFSLPGSRLQETEADRIGLQIMAEGNYDPSAALDLWARWSAVEADERPQYLRTHPSNFKRLETINSWISQARRNRVVSVPTSM